MHKINDRRERELSPRRLRLDCNFEPGIYFIPMTVLTYVSAEVTVSNKLGMHEKALSKIFTEQHNVRCSYSRTHTPAYWAPSRPLSMPCLWGTDLCMLFPLPGTLHPHYLLVSDSCCPGNTWLESTSLGNFSLFPTLGWLPRCPFLPSECLSL